MHKFVMNNCILRILGIFRLKEEEQTVRSTDIYLRECVASEVLQLWSFSLVLFSHRKRISHICSTENSIEHTAKTTESIL
jgi:hypothetical protein